MPEISKKSVLFSIRSLRASFLFILFFTTSSFPVCQAQAQTNISHSTAITDVNYNFDENKLSASKNYFHFLRSFVDYYYLLISVNLNSQPILQNLNQTRGWCVGDAHPENFGIQILENQNRIFTVNDMDDAGPCPLGIDFFRLLLSSNIYDNNLDLKNLIIYYTRGLLKQNQATPDVVQSMYADSMKKGLAPNPNAIDNNKFILDGNARALSQDEKNQIIQILSNTFQNLGINNFQFLDFMETSKVGGGSGGLSRYEVLIQLHQDVYHLEMKELTTPAIYPLANSEIPSQSDRIAKTLMVEQNQNYSHFYQVLNLFNKPYLLRPKFHGNRGANLNNLGTSDASDLINYEAYVLGTIHANSLSAVDNANYVNQIKQIDTDSLVTLVESFNKFFKNKYKSISNQ